MRRYLIYSGRTALLALALLGLSVLLVSATPLVIWWTGRLAEGGWRDARGDVLIVLSGAESNGTVDVSGYWRSVYGAMTWKRGRYREMIVSGGGKPMPGAEAARAFLECLGVPKDKIRVENRSMSTRENALFTAHMLEGVAGTKVLVTSDFHMYRARRAFLKAGLDVVPQPFPDVEKRAQSPRNRWNCLLDLLEETVKILYYRLRGWI